MTERQEMIKNELILNHRVAVKSLSIRYHVSEVTIRHDLAQLEKEGYAKRIFGGAIRNDSAASLVTPDTTSDPLSSAIAAEARTLISDGDCIYLGAGRTCCYLARHLKGLRDLTVFTNNIAAIGDLANADARIYILGGELIYKGQKTPMTYSDDDVYQIVQHYIQKAFTSISGIDLDAGLTSDSAWAASIGKYIPEKSHEWILMADHTKFNQISVYESARFEDVSHLVTDSLPQEYITAAHRCGMQIHLAVTP